MDKILITGGAGYIGSNVLKLLLEKSTHDIVVLDNLSNSSIKTIEVLQKIRSFVFIKEDLKNFSEIEKVFNEHRFTTVIHFAASIVVGESVKNPAFYYQNNTANTINLIKCANECGVKKFIFSSTAAVYGEPSKNADSIRENMSLKPINPYGMSKLMSENILKDVSLKNKNLKYVIFRYFNVAGASDDLLIGECHSPETHLVPLVAQTALGLRDKISIFGDDYSTKDGTNIRDYIHVVDLAMAHIMAVDYLDSSDSDVFNCGYGNGYSVMDICKTMIDVSGVEFSIEIAPRRTGDPSVLVANSDKLKKYMDWKPLYNNISKICSSAYEWEKKR